MQRQPEILKWSGGSLPNDVCNEALPVGDISKPPTLHWLQVVQRQPETVFPVSGCLFIRKHARASYWNSAQVPSASQLALRYKRTSLLVDASCGCGSIAPVSSARMVLASCLPSSTPHWSKLLMPQITPWVKTLCSYMAIRLPMLRGVILSSRITLVGRLPLNVLCGTSFLIFSPSMPCACNSARTSSAVLPRIKASAWAKTLDNRIS